jgi:hypothetical protein
MNEAIVAIIATATVAIFSGLIPVLLDYIQARRSSKATSIEQINNSTIELLTQLAHFFGGSSIADIANAADTNEYQAYSDLRKKHYAWERDIWAHLNQPEHDQVKEIRESLEKGGNVYDFLRITPKDLSSISDKILNITNVAVSSIEK